MTQVSRIDAARGNGSTASVRPLRSLELALQRVRLTCKRRIAFLQHLRGGQPAGTGLIAPVDLQLGLDDRDSPAAEREFFQSAPLRPLADELAACEAASARLVHEPLARLRQAAGLSERETDVLETCLALALDPGLAPSFAFLHNHPARQYVSEQVVARLFGHGRTLLLRPEGNLLRLRLVRVFEAPHAPTGLELDPFVLARLLGETGVDGALVDRLQSLPALEPLASWPVRSTAENVRKALEQRAAVRVVVEGPSGSGRRSFARAVSAQLGLPALGLDARGAEPNEFRTLHVHAQRQALLDQATLVWSRLADTHDWPGQALRVPLQFIVIEPGATASPWQGVTDLHVRLPVLSLDERAALWRVHVPAMAAFRPEDAARLTERYRLTPGEIASLGQRGVDSVEGAAEVCRDLTRHRLGELGTLVDCPFTRDDLVLSDKLAQELDDFLFEATERVRFWDDPAARRVFPRGTGHVALFTGSPGTGKTMAAQVVAAELGLDLFRIDLASAVSKYIGETAKNLRSIFARAAHMNAVLLFDEADALFTKRTDVKDAHDRHANADTNYLLQLLEDYAGIALLSTNQKGNIDAAFLRRLRFVLDFPRPGKEEQLRIWTGLVLGLAGQERATALTPALRALADTLELSGAQIKLALLSGIFMARRARAPLALEHLLSGVERELVKDGHALRAQDREKVYRRVR